MAECAQVLSVEHCGGRRLRISFADGCVRVVTMLANWSGKYEPLNHDRFIAQVAVDPETATLTWPGGIDLDPEVLRGTDQPVGAPFYVLEEEIVGTPISN